jgi:decaprenyl-phosphate phosphoribosyltransferase
MTHPTAKLPVLIRLMRPKQWTKNLFVLAPLIFSFRLTDVASLESAVLAMVLFCLCASIIYIVNDVRDMVVDRLHVWKKKRPLASGDVSRQQALAFAALLMTAIIGIGLTSHFDRLFWLFFALYAVLGLFYSFGLKQVTLLELFVVASGYVLRLLAGCAALKETPSPWILAATGTVALLIVAGKRRAEIAENHDPAKLRRSLRDYNVNFLDSAITMLAATTVVTYLLFTTSDYAIERFQSPYFVVTSVFVLYGVLRYMQLVKVMTGADDPTSLVLTDLNLACSVIGWLATCIGMIYL